MIVWKQTSYWTPIANTTINWVFVDKNWANFWLLPGEQTADKLKGR